MAERGIDADDGRMRAVIERITPSVDNGRFAAKRIVGDPVAVDGEVVPRSAWERTVVGDGQELEVLRAVQGG